MGGINGGVSEKLSFTIFFKHTVPFYIKSPAGITRRALKIYKLFCVFISAQQAETAYGNTA